MKKILTNTWAVLEKPERKRFTLLVLFDIFISIADIVSLALLLWIINFYIQPAAGQDSSFLPGWLADRNSVWLIALFFLLFGIKNMVAWFVSKAWYTFIGQVAVRISRLNLRTYQQSGFAGFTDTDSSVHIRKIGFLPFEFCQYILSGIPQIITQASLILLTILAILLFNAKLFLLLLIILLPPVVAIFYFIRKRLTTVRSQIKTGHEKSVQYLLDALKGYVESNVYNRNDFFLDRFVQSRKKFSNSLFESISIQTLPPRVIEIFAVLGLFILLILAKLPGNSSTDYLVTIGAFVGAAYKIIPGLVKIINLSGQVNAYAFSFTDLLQEGQFLGTAKKEMPPKGLKSVHLKNISFSYEREVILKDFSLTVEKGDFLVITGESGKGKTTILNLLLGFLQPTGGTMLVNGIVIQPKDFSAYWPFISYVKQQSFLIHDTILRNITLEEDQHHEKNLKYAIDVSGLRPFIETSAEGLGKMITENGKNISGGQRQRIAIARALYNNADLLVLDEPFNELDEESEFALLQNCKQMAEAGKMIILITHNKKSLSFCNKMISLDEKQ